MDFLEMYNNHDLLATRWPQMRFLDRCRFIQWARRRLQLEEDARAVAAETRLRASLVEELGQEEADALWKALNGDMPASSAFWQDDARNAPEGDGKTPPAEKPRQYSHLSYAERVAMITLRNEGSGIRSIARKMHRNPGTVSRELRRLENTCSLFSRYNPDEAQAMYKSLRKHCGRLSVLTQATIDIIYELMKKRRMSPEQIANTKLKGVVSKASIYRGFDRGVFASDAKRYLWRKGKKRRKSPKNKKYEAGRSIHERPIDVLLRMEFGHWEVDTVESCRKGSGCVFVLHERKTRFTITCRSLFFDARSMKNFILKTIRRFPKGAFKSITCDRGKEFAEYYEIEEKTGVQVYFADPHSPNQKGSVEHVNGLIRRFFPKGTDFGKINSTILYHRAISYINAWPMEVLGWATPRQAFLGELASL